MPQPSPSVAADEAALQELAHVLAHRLRGLVAGIEGYADLLTDLLATREQRECALRIVEGTVRIERVLAELQHYSRPVVPVVVPLAAGEVVQGALAMLDPADGARVEVAGGGPGDGPAFAGDPRLVRQALLVLLQNAIEAGRGRVGLEVTAEETARGGEVVFTVRNDGVIDEVDAAEQVFVPFYTTKAQNLGVGLAIARRIAAVHGGALGLVANSPGTGVAFALRLPVEEAGAEPAAGRGATFADLR